MAKGCASNSWPRCHGHAVVGLEQDKASTAAWTGDVLFDDEKENQLLNVAKKEQILDSDGELRGEAAADEKTKDDGGLDLSKSGIALSSVAAALPMNVEEMNVEVERSCEPLEWEEEECVQCQVLEQRNQEVLEKRPVKKNSKPAADVADAIAAAIAATMTARTAAVPATSAAAANNNSEAGTRPQWRCVRQHQKRQRWKAGVLQLWSEKQSLKKMARQRAIQMMLRAKLTRAVSGICVYTTAS